MIDVHAQEGMPPLGNELDTPALIAERFDHRGQHGLQLFQLARHPKPSAHVVEIKNGRNAHPSCHPTAMPVADCPANKKPLNKGLLYDWLRRSEERRVGKV